MTIFSLWENMSRWLFTLDYVVSSAVKAESFLLNNYACLICYKCWEDLKSSLKFNNSCFVYFFHICLGNSIKKSVCSLKVIITRSTMFAFQYNYLSGMTPMFQPTFPFERGTTQLLRILQLFVHNTQNWYGEFYYWKNRLFEMFCSPQHFFSKIIENIATTSWRVYHKQVKRDFQHYL